MNSTGLLERSPDVNDGFGENDFEIPLQSQEHFPQAPESISASQLGVFSEYGIEPEDSNESEPQIVQEPRENPGIITDVYQGRHTAPNSSYQGDRQLASLIEPEGIVEPRDRKSSYLPRHAAQPRLESLANSRAVEPSRARSVGRPLLQKVVSVFSPTKYLEGRSFARRPPWKY